jgi:hypothetical protein
MDLDPTWSLNRVQIVDLPGLRIPAGVRGKTAYELASATALTQLFREHATQLKLDPSLSDSGLRLAFDGCLVSDDPVLRSEAGKIARTYGRDLGYVILALKRGDDANRTARPEWGKAHWDRWAETEQVWLGGGLVSGNLGPHIARHANQVMREGKVYDCVVNVSPYGALLPLVGAARHAPRGTEAAVVLDFGSTTVKRAWVTLAGDQILNINPLLSQPAPDSVRGQATRAKADRLIDNMVSIFARTWRRAAKEGLSLSGTVPICLAAYVRDGHPMVAHAGGYYQVSFVTDNLQAELGRRVSKQLGMPLSVKLLHDGSAAAAAYAGQQRAAVIVMGTALGIGFPGNDADLRPLGLLVVSA